jgi:hypothetical protein
VRRKNFGGKGARHVANRDLIFAKGKLRRTACGCIEHGTGVHPS